MGVVGDEGVGEIERSGFFLVVVFIGGCSIFICERE